MALKLLVFGLPGGGKSTIARYIATYLKDRNWESLHFSDHVILRDMFLADIEEKQFEPSKLLNHEGFNVKDIKVFDIALKKLEFIVKIHLLYTKQEEIVLIEFARNDYRWAFQQFSNQFLFDAYFLYLNVDLEICKNRVRERITHKSTDDDFYVSEDIFKSYYYGDDGQSIRQMLTEVYGIDVQRILIIDNNGSLEDSITQVYKFVDMMCGF